MHNKSINFALVANLCWCLFVAGCGGAGSSKVASGGTNVTITTGSTATGIYAVENLNFFLPPAPALVLQFSKTASGTVSEAPTLFQGPPLTVFDSVAIDKAGKFYFGGKTYNTAGGVTGLRVFIYSAGAHGSVNPAQVIDLPYSGYSYPAVRPLVVDSQQNLYVVTQEGILVYSPSSGGVYSRTRAIGGDATGIGGLAGIAVDSAGDLYVACDDILNGPGKVRIFSSAANGNVAPNAVLAPVDPDFYDIGGIAVDSSGAIYVAAGPNFSSSTSEGTPGIFVFAPGSTGNATPTRVIMGGATGLTKTLALEVDSTGIIYALNPWTVLTFGPGANGNTAPTSSFTSTSIDSLSGFAVY